MKKFQTRLVAGLLALTLCGSPAVPGVAAEEPELPAEEVGREEVLPFSVTVGSYTPQMAGSEKIRQGETYTLIALPAAWAGSQGDGNVATLTPAELISATGQALFMGSAVASANGKVTFEDVRLRTADAAVYYVTGPGLDTPLYEATNSSTEAYGTVYTDDVSDHSATISLVDAVTGYRYGQPAQASASGSVSMNSLAPGTYNILVTKPGYLPTTLIGVSIPDGQTTPLGRLNISSVNRGANNAAQHRIGDVNNDASRNMTDLAALLMYYGRPGDVPQGITADLNGDGAVDQTDVTLLLTAAAKPTPKDITTGTAENVTGAKITVADTGAAAGAALRSLSIGVETTATVSAAAVSISYRYDDIQPLNAKGGLVSPVDGGTLASCLVPASGVAARLTRWSVAGETVTLSFALTADSPKAAGELAKFYYRPVSGTTAGLYSDVFTLDHAVAVVGKDTVVTDQTLTYPGSDSVSVTGITIDQQPAAGEDALVLTIPAAGRTAVLPLSATGRNGANTYPDLPGVVWALARADGESLEGVSVERGLLTVTSQATAGSVQVTASRDGVTSQPLTVELKNAPPVASFIRIFKDGQPCESDVVEMDITSGGATYTATVYDQYGQPLAQQPELSWSLVGAPVGVNVEDGIVYVSHDVQSQGRWVISVVAQAEGLQAVMELDLTLTTRVFGYFVTGPTYLTVPEDGDEPISYSYLIVGYDAEGRLVELTEEDIPYFGPTYGDFEGLGVSKEMDGSYSVTISSDSDAIGRFTFDVGRDQDPAKDVVNMTVRPHETDGDAVRAGIFYDGEAFQVLRLSVPAGVATTLPFAAHMLDRDGAIAADQPQEKWNWTGGCQWTDYSIHISEEGELVVGDNVAPGTYLVNMSIDNPELRLGIDSSANQWVVDCVIVLEVAPTLSKLELAAPATLNIPTLENLNYTLMVTGQDAGGKPMELPGDLAWSVTAKGGTNAPAGVSVDKGVLTVTPAAAPGDITVTVSDKSGKITASADITLAPAGAETAAFALYRQITVDGETVEKSAPVTAAGDTLDVKEGQRVEIRYTPMLVNQTTGAATAVRANQVKWMGGSDAFIVDANAENGVYISNLTAIYNGQMATATATVNVEPDIQGLTLDFGDGQSAPPYSFPVPNRGSKSYTATVMARIKRGGATQTVPLNDLGLRDYDLVMATALTGLYATMDKASGTMTFTIDPAAVDNPTSAPSNGDVDIRYIQLQLDCVPGGSHAYNLTFNLVPETSKATQAVLRRGVGAGTSFAFDTPKEDSVTAAPGVLSNCYALELLDQYKSPVVNETVTWDLTVPDALMSGSTRLVSLVEPGDGISEAYPGYASIRRLRVLSGAPVGGPYDLVLTASAAGFTCTRHISLTVRDRDPAEGIVVTMSGDGMVTIPMHYAKYNATDLNSAKSTGSFTAVLRTGTDALENNEELSAEGFRILWTVTDPEGKVPTGVTIAANKDNAAHATLSVDRTAQPTGTNKKRQLTVTATAVDAAGNALASDSAQVELARGMSVPTLMRIRKNGSNITQDSVSMAATQTKTERDYTFYLVDQYNQPVSANHLAGVTWSVTSSSVTTLTTQKGEDGALSAHLEIVNSGKKVNTTVYLKASIAVDEPKAPGGKQEVFLQIPISIAIDGPSSNLGGGGGGGGGGDVGTGDTTTTAGVPSTITISGNTAITTTQGTPATRTYSFILRDKNGNNCSLSEQSKVTWLYTGLSGGLTFDSATRTLTVPANALVGTYTVRLTAKYSSSVQASVNVTVTVKAKEDDKTDQTTPATSAATVTPSVTQSGTAGTATLTAEQEKALTAATASGGTVTIAPTGGSGLTSLSVNLSAITASALANQKNQSLKVQTALGTVVLPPAALRGLAGQGGSTVTVKLTSAGGSVQVDFLCGSNVATLSGKATVSLPTSGNVALQVNGDGSQSVLKKAIVQNGRLLAYVDGSTQLRLETRAPSFSDTQNHWAQEAIAFTAARELFQGTSATTFSPNDTMTRSMVVTVLHRLEDTPAAAASASFADVAQGTWYTAAVNWANAKGIVQGTSAGFKPGDPVTREQLATILYRYAADQGLATSQRASLSRFSDSARVSGWATEAMQWAVSIGLINGKSGGVLDPTGNASRAEVSAILQRLIVYMAPTV